MTRRLYTATRPFGQKTGIIAIERGSELAGKPITMLKRWLVKKRKTRCRLVLLLTVFVLSLAFTSNHCGNPPGLSISANADPSWDRTIRLKTRSYYEAFSYLPHRDILSTHSLNVELFAPSRMAHGSSNERRAPLRMWMWIDTDSLGYGDACDTRVVYFGKKG